MSYIIASETEDLSPTIEDILSHPDYYEDTQQQAVDRGKMCQNEALGPRPLTCFLYNGLTTKQLRSFLLDRRASAACVLYHLTRLEDTKSNHTTVQSTSSIHSAGNCHGLSSTNGFTSKPVAKDTSHTSHAFDYTILTLQKKQHRQNLNNQVTSLNDRQ